MKTRRTHKLKINGREVSPRQFFRGKPRGGGGVASVEQTCSESHPHHSLAQSCHREMVGEYRAFVKQHGLTGVHFDDEGECTVTSSRDFVKYLKLRGLHNEDAGLSGW